MEQYELVAYQVFDVWSIHVKRVVLLDGEPPRRELIYRGDHVPIDEEDPVMRAALLLHQVHHDLADAVNGEVPVINAAMGH